MMDVELDEAAAEVLDKALRNSLIVKKICSFTTSQKDLLSLRLVSHLFHTEATNRLRIVHVAINLTSDYVVRDFLACMRTHEEFELFPFPFSNFKLDPSLGTAAMQSFGEAVGQHARQYSISRPLTSFLSVSKWNVNVAIILTHSPQLEAIEIRSTYALHIFAHDLARIPARFPLLKKINVVHNWLNIPSRLSPDPNSVPLLQLLVSRAPELQSIMIPIPITDTHLPDMRLLRTLAKTHENCPNVLFDGEVKIGLYNYNHVQDLIGMNLHHTNLLLQLFYQQQGHHDNLDRHEPEVQDLLRAVSAWLGIQTNCLTTLQVGLFMYLPMVSFILPPLKALIVLELMFEYDVEDGVGIQILPNSRPIAPMTPENFPALQKLSLKFFREDYGIFTLGSLPSVQELLLIHPRGLITDPFWALTFPNLTSLSIQVRCQSGGTAGPTIAFILTHFTRLAHLNLLLMKGSQQPNYHYEPDFWDIFTGRAPRVETDALLNGEVDRIVGESADHMKGPCQVPSLRNMTGLKTMVFNPVSLSNLSAIVYMTCTGSLVPLDRLCMFGLECDFRISAVAKSLYQERLSLAHADVQLD